MTTPRLGEAKPKSYYSVGLSRKVWQNHKEAPNSTNIDLGRSLPLTVLKAARLSLFRKPTKLRMAALQT